MDDRRPSGRTPRRRRFLATLAALGVAGCLGVRRSGGAGSSTDGPRGAGAASNGSGTATRTPGERPAGGTDSANGGRSGTRPGDVVDLPVERSALTRAAARDAIPAITDPAFASDYGSVEADLGPDSTVIGVERDGRSRAYPLSVVSFHEVVNDDFGGPLLVTYCSLCGSAMTAERLVGGDPTVFGVSGLLFRSNLVLYDRRTRSLWSQILARAINGPATGQRLTLVPSTLSTWGAWRERHPATEVLLPPPASGTVAEPVDAGLDAGNDGGHVGVPVDFAETDDGRLPSMARVIGVTTDGAAVAYPLSAVRAAGVANDRVGDLPVVVAAGPGGTLYAYERRVGCETVTFETAGPRRIRGGGSTWSVTTGRALDGSHEGRRLPRASATSMFWFAWTEFHPGTEVYRA